MDFKNIMIIYDDKGVNLHNTRTVIHVIPTIIAFRHEKKTWFLRCSGNNFFTFAPLSALCGQDCLPTLKLWQTMPDGVIGNTSDSESEESRFDPWSGNKGFSR